MTKKPIPLLLFFILLLPICVKSQDVEVIKYKDLKALIEDPVSEITLINFWATWCRPCIKEIPFFESVRNQYRDEGVRVVLVTLDFADDLESRVEPFVKKNGLQSEVMLLDETDYDYIIRDVSKEWSGAIPATLLINRKTGERNFYEKEFKEGELDLIIQAQIQKL